MSLKSTTFLFMALTLNLLHRIDASPTNKNTEAFVKVPFGDTVTLMCESNDENHTFFYWYLNEKNVIIGPSSNGYNNGKFRYEVLSGNLTVKEVSKDEEGIYNCVSRGIRKDDVNIRSVRMVLEEDWEEVYEHDSNESEEDDDTDEEPSKVTSIKDKISGVLFGVALPKLGQIIGKIKEKRHELKGDFGEHEGGMNCPVSKIDIKHKIATLKVNLFRVVIVLGTLMVVSGVGYAGYKIWKDRYRYPRYLVPSDDDEEDSELFIAPGASRDEQNMVKTNSTDSFERPGISTDFESILDTATKK